MMDAQIAALEARDSSHDQAVHIHVDGIVQGVGFRPFVYSLAKRLDLHGWVRNTSAGVDVEVEGPEAALQAFVDALRQEAPPLARVEALTVGPLSPNGCRSFEIIASQAVEAAYQPISPDVALCPDCRRELLDPDDRRYRYPFINCTNCGPRFTIIRDIPYDRPLTTMAAFDLCPACQAEYDDPLDRRFHAQPVACPACGPHVWFEIDLQLRAEHEAGLRAARALLAGGHILAVKGLGGFHLACNAASPSALQTLRERKGRVDKPFALMMPDLDAIRRHCFLSPAEARLLESPEHPVVILQRRPESELAEAVAPRQATVGVMLPYTPLHVLLLEPAAGFPDALVMTSGNLSEEPIATDNHDATQRLKSLADGFLMHDRDIQTRCDDSVVRVVHESVYPIRRARGYAPAPIRLPFDMPPVLATGAELKNTFCLTRDRNAFLSHHIGDLENYETLQAYESGIEHYRRLFRIKPELVAYDLHPDYLATRYALAQAEAGLPAVGIQHHHAHIAAAMADAGLDGSVPVLGVAFDGTGYGTDGLIWGGEFLAADYLSFDRLYHLAPFPMPGGDAAVREPWRLALSLLRQAGLAWDPDLPSVAQAEERTRSLVARQLDQGLNSPLTTSFGRLFDGVSSLAGVCHRVNYEGQAAIELEALADPAETGAYDFELTAGGVVDPAPVIASVLHDVRRGASPARISARFHRGAAAMVIEVCRRVRVTHAIETIALSGGVWQNLTLLEAVRLGLDGAGFNVVVHRQVPANDGGLALGQAVIAGARAAAGLVPEIGR